MSILDKAVLISTPNAYKAGKLYSIVPSNGSGDMNVVRSTTATRVNNLGIIETIGVNVPRLDYLNTTCPKLLLEPQVTNLTKNNQVFNTSFWTKNAVTVIDNNTISPDGTTNATIVTESLGSNIQRNVQEATASFTPTQQYSGYTMSCFVKLPSTNAGRYVQLVFSTPTFGSNVYVNFDLLNNVIGSNGGGVTRATITNYGNGWKRISATSYVNALQPSLFQLSLIPSATSSRNANYSVFSGNQKSIFMFGAQIEKCPIASSYIPTQASTVTRNADKLSSSLNLGFNYTLFIDLVSLVSFSNNQYCGDFKSASGTQGLFIITTGDNLRYTIYYNDNLILHMDSPYIHNVGDRVKAAIVKNGSLYKLFVNGVLVSVKNYTAPTNESINNILLPQNFDDINTLRLNQFMAFPVLTDNEAIYLTKI